MAGGGQGAGYAQGGQLMDMLNQQNPMGGMGMQSAYNNFASPNQNMGFQPQGPADQPPPLSGTLPPTANTGGPDAGADYASANMGFDNSGSDAGAGGQPVNQMQTPLQQGNKPLGLAQFQSPQGLQIAGNPTSQVVQRP